MVVDSYMMLVEPIRLFDGLVTLAEITLNNAVELHAMLSDKQLCDNAGLIQHTHIHQTFDFIIEGNLGVKNSQQYFYGIYVDSVLVGLINLFNLNYIEKTGEYGYFISSDHLRKGYMIRAIKLLSNYVLENTALNKINVYVDVSNKPSLGLAKKLALKPAETSLEVDLQDRNVDMIRYEIDSLFDS